MQLRVDVAGVRFMVTKAHEPKVDFETKAQKVDRRTGALMWQIQLMALDESGGEILPVVVDAEPAFPVGEFVRVENLVAMPWSQGERSGVSFRAGRISSVERRQARRRREGRLIMADLDVVEGLRSWARGDYAEEAGVELLVRAFGGRFADPGWPWIQACDRPGWYWVDAECMPANWGVLSRGERRVLALVAGLIADVPVEQLGLSLSGLDRSNLRLILAAIAHASGSHQHSGLSDDNGQLRLVQLPTLFGWPAEPSRIG